MIDKENTLFEFYTFVHHLPSVKVIDQGNSRITDVFARKDKANNFIYTSADVDFS
jgi:hypothetical protein